MDFWYGIIRTALGKVVFKRIATDKIQTQKEFLQSLEYDYKSGDVVIELDRGNHMTHDEFTRYVYSFYKNDKKITIKDIEKLTNGN